MLLNQELYDRIVKTSNEVHAKTLAGPNYIPLRKHWIEEMTMTQDDFNKAWSNFTHVPNDPKERLRDLVKDRLGIDIMYIQAMRVLEESYKNAAGYVDWDCVRIDVESLADDEVMTMFYEFVKKNKGE